MTKKLIQIARTTYRLLLWNVIRRLRSRILVTTPQGRYKIVLDKEDSISRSLFLYKKYHQEHMARAASFLESEFKHKPGVGTLLDIGANNGVISIGMLAKGYFERAIAIEPDPVNFELLEQNIELNHLGKRFVTINTAVSEKRGKLELELDESNFGDHRVRTQHLSEDLAEIYGESSRRTILVESIPLDDLMQEIDSYVVENISMAWIDIQGHEGHAFLGARELFTRDIPVVSEVWPYGILRSGQSLKEFEEIISSIWSSFWVWRRGKFVRYPMEMFSYFLEELGVEGDFEDIIFSK